jgi:hypothetical protein
LHMMPKYYMLRYIWCKSTISSCTCDVKVIHAQIYAKRKYYMFCTYDSKVLHSKVRSAIQISFNTGRCYLRYINKLHSINRYNPKTNLY